MKDPMGGFWIHPQTAGTLLHGRQTLVQIPPLEPRSPVLWGTISYDTAFALYWVTPNSVTRWQMQQASPVILLGRKSRDELVLAIKAAGFSPWFFYKVVMWPPMSLLPLWLHLLNVPSMVFRLQEVPSRSQMVSRTLYPIDHHLFNCLSRRQYSQCQS